MICSNRFVNRVFALSILLAALVLALAPSRARADDSAVKPPDPGVTASAAPPDVPPPGAERTPTESGEMVLAVVRLPPSAYPEWRTRGIPGGSLWLDPSFHGMQWPYYPKTGIGFSGSVWADNSYQQINREQKYPQTSYWVHQARAVLRATPTYTSGDFFVQGQVELVGNNNQSTQRLDAPDTDDLWLRFGVWNRWDIQVGRFEAYPLHHFGMGLDLNTVERLGALDENSRQPVDFYYATTMYYRPSGAGNIAFHLHLFEGDKALPAVRFEMLAQYGFDSFDRIGARPAAVIDYGMIKVKLGGEYRLTRPRDTQVTTNMTPRVNGQGNPVIDPGTGSQIIDISYTQTRREEFKDRGFSAAVQLVLFPWVEAGVQGAYGLSDHTPQMGGSDFDGSFTQWTVGGFVNVSPLPALVVGFGAHLTDWTNLHKNDLGQFGHQTNLATFAAVQFLVRKQLYVKVIGAYDKGVREDLEGGTTRVATTMFSGRLRLMYLF
jgi:hypothetical protein